MDLQLQYLLITLDSEDLSVDNNLQIFSRVSRLGLHS